jgi:hypothetical protein
MPRLSKIGAAALAAFGWTGLASVSASYLVVAGGGGGGFNGGGGGAGGLLTGTASLNLTLSYTVTVGGGGSGGTSNSSSNTGTNGSNSVFSSFTAIGGGSGGDYARGSGNNGGSGGGVGGDVTGGLSGTVGTGSQGSSGGQQIGSGNWNGGGGGGASAVGGNGVSGTRGGNGGAGTASSISGTSVTYAGGGGGASNMGASTGGSGGGGNGAFSGTSAGTNGTANTGGGGGGNAASYGNGNTGGSGVVIISYPAPQQFGGGVVTTSGSNVIHTFNTSGTLTPLSALTASALVVGGGGAGGGGAGGTGGGGGGAGGYRTITGLTIDTNSIYLVTVGAGGAANSAATSGSSGTDSLFSSTTSTGGGGGGYQPGQDAKNGGSGGGAGSDSPTASSAGTGNTPSTSPSQGSNGGTASNAVTYSGGGGGGASQAGSNGSASTGGGKGGDGSTWSVNSVTYAGGGGGGRGTSGSGTAGAGGTGGGGTGSYYLSTQSTAGTANLGGGGGGGSGPSYPSGAGGSGIVIISYAGSTQQMAGGTVTISGGNIIHTFTSSGYLTPIKLVNNSLRFRNSASAYLSRTPATAGNTQKWTMSFWLKRGSLSQSRSGVYSTTGTVDYIEFGGGYGQYDFEVTLNNASGARIATNALYRDPAAWYHFVIAIDTTQATASNRMLLYVNGIQITSFASASYPAQNYNTAINSAVAQYIGADYSLTSGQYFDGYMTEYNFVDGQQLTPNSFGTFNSYGVWQPITYGGSYGNNGFYLPFTKNTASYAGYFGGSGYSIVTTATQIVPATGDFTIEAMINFASLASYPVICSQGTSGTAGRFDFIVSATGYVSMFTDAAGAPQSAAGVITTNQWYYIAATRSGANTVIYVNGKQVASSSSSIGTVQNTTFKIGVDYGGDYISSGYVSNVRVSNTVRTISPATAPTTNFTNDANTVLLTLQGSTIVDNSSNAYALTNNGPVTTGQTYPFAYNIFNDAGPAGNNWTPNNISGVTGTTLDFMNDVPTLTSATAANYCVLSPLWPSSVVSGGNLNIVGDSNSRTVVGSIVATTGKWYAEGTFTSGYATNGWFFVWDTSTPYVYGNLPSTTGQTGAYYQGTSGNITKSVTGTTTSIGTYSTWTNGDIIGMAFDADAGTISFYKNNTLQVTITDSAFIGRPLTFGIYYYAGNASMNFGQRPFSYTPPTGYVALNTYNL